MNKLKELFVKYREIISYLFWGGMTTVVSWGTYSIFAIVFADMNNMIRILGLEMSVKILLANALSWVCAVIFAYVTNKLWVFQSKSWKAKVWLPEFAKFVSTRLLTGAGEIVAVPLLVSLGLNQTILGIEGMVSKVVVSVLVVILNYIFSKLFIFKSKEEKK